VNGLDIDVEAVLDRTRVGDVGIDGSADLLRFVDAVLGGDPTVGDARTAVRNRFGDEGLWEACATIAVFCGLVRVADGTGIPLDDGLHVASADLRAAHGIDRFAGAANAAVVGDLEIDHTDVQALFR
jgi:hypothetical protein